MIAVIWLGEAAECFYSFLHVSNANGDVAELLILVYMICRHKEVYIVINSFFLNYCTKDCFILFS